MEKKEVLMWAMKGIQHEIDYLRDGIRRIERELANYKSSPFRPDDSTMKCARARLAEKKARIQELVAKCEELMAEENAR